jgi:hypothetical protein
METTRLQLRLAPSALAGLLLTLMAGTPVNAGDDDRGGQVVPPQTCAYGKTYSEWSIDWWQWATKLPATHHPLFDTADISAGQSGNVWFLGGKFCALNLIGCTGIAVRSNTITEGKALFFTIVGAECSAAEGNGSTYYDFRNCAQPFVDLWTNIECDIDGVMIPGLDQPGNPYRVLSPLFTYTLSSHDNIWAAVGETLGNPPVPVPDGVTTPAVSDGYWVFLEPLPRGKHVLHFHAEFSGIIEDITYYLNVAPKHRSRD